MIDLHTHSTYSDGSDTPTQLAQQAHEMGISAISLTDHDTTRSSAEMAEACSDLGLTFIPGVEVSLRDPEFTQRSRDGEVEAIHVHVLGYWVPSDPSHPLQQKLATLRHDRVARNERLVRVLNEQGFDQLSVDYLVAMVGNVDSIGRPHFARAMFDLHPEIVGERTPESWNQLFVEWLGKGGHAYVPKGTMTIDEFVSAGTNSGVAFSIAHPLVNYVTSTSLDTIAREMPTVLSSLKDRGFVGAEAYYGGTNKATRDLMVKLTRDAGLIPTGGSDYHGTYKLDVALGRGRAGDLVVPDGILDELEAAR